MTLDIRIDIEWKFESLVWIKNRCDIIYSSTMSQVKVRLKEMQRDDKMSRRCRENIIGYTVRRPFTMTR